MCDHETELSSTEYTAPNGTRYRIRILQDPDASSPRENDNATVIHTFDRSWISPDGEPERNGTRTPRPLIPREYIYDNGRVNMRFARRWVNLFGQYADPEVLAIAGVERIRGGWAEGGLQITTNDDRADGYVAITRESWGMCMGADVPLAGGARVGTDDPPRLTPDAAEVMRQDVAEYSRWAAGEYVGFVVERAVTWVPKDSIDDEGDTSDAPELVTWVQLDDAALWGIDDEAYALTEALTYLPAGSVAADPMP